MGSFSSKLQSATFQPETGRFPRRTLQLLRNILRCRSSQNKRTKETHSYTTFGPACRGAISFSGRICMQRSRDEELGSLWMREESGFKVEAGMNIGTISIPSSQCCIYQF